MLVYPEILHMYMPYPLVICFWLLSIHYPVKQDIVYFTDKKVLCVILIVICWSWFAFIITLQCFYKTCLFMWELMCKWFLLQNLPSDFKYTWKAILCKIYIKRFNTLLREEGTMSVCLSVSLPACLSDCFMITTM